MASASTYPSVSPAAAAAVDPAGGCTATRHAVGYRRYATGRSKAPVSGGASVQFRPCGQFPLRCPAVPGRSQCRLGRCVGHITVQPGRARALIHSDSRRWSAGWSASLPQQRNASTKTTQVPAEAQQAKNRAHWRFGSPVRFTENKLCQQVMQEVVAAAVRQSVRERGGVIRHGRFLSLDKALPEILNWSATASRAYLRGAGENTPRSVLFSCVASNFGIEEDLFTAFQQRLAEGGELTRKVYSRWRLLRSYSSRNRVSSPDPAAASAR